VIKAADMMIARRADTRARADFATWNMMAKLNGASSLPPEAQSFLAQYKAMLKENTEAEAGEAPNVEVHPVGASQTSGNVTAFKRPSPQRAKSSGGPQTKPRLPVALIFACLVIVYTGFRYFFR
jgi:hypothetical protein